MAALSTAQDAALGELWSFTNASTQIRLVKRSVQGNTLAVTLELDTSGFERKPDGLPAQAREQVDVLVSAYYPLTPPTVGVSHWRWVGFPHVLLGTRLCIYLDPATEWNPEQGIQEFLKRLWKWFDDAIANRFDPATALYHPVGGVLHRTPGAPTVVATEPIPSIDLQNIANRITLQPRTDHRIDITAWKAQTGPDLAGGLLVTLPKQIPWGGGDHLSSLLKTVNEQAGRDARRALARRLRRAIQALDSTQYLHVVIAVPNPVEDAPQHLIGWRLSQQSANEALTAARNTTNRPQDNNQQSVEWTYIDDQRPEIAVRRDSERPVSVYKGSTVAIWGCGAIGSWVAEQLVRAGARNITLRDPGVVTRGLLVRQNYTETDVGRPKAEALAARLRHLSDTTDISDTMSYAENGLIEDTTGCDFIFDTTVNTSVSAVLSDAQRKGTLQVPVIQIATDNQTATLAIITVTDGTPTPTTNDLDQSLQDKARQTPNLAAFLTFWDERDHPPLLPTPGCSIPTFHGSAADAMSIAASAVNLSAIPLARRCAGGYLFALPYSHHKAPPCTEV